MTIGDQIAAARSADEPGSKWTVRLLLLRLCLTVVDIVAGGTYIWSGLPNTTGDEDSTLQLRTWSAQFDSRRQPNSGWPVIVIGLGLAMDASWHLHGGKQR